MTTSPGARAYYDAQRSRGATHHQALRALGNRLVGLLHGCLRRRSTYDEHKAWTKTSTALLHHHPGLGPSVNEVAGRSCNLWPGLWRALR